MPDKLTKPFPLLPNQAAVLTKPLRSPNSTTMTPLPRVFRVSKGPSAFFQFPKTFLLGAKALVSRAFSFPDRLSPLRHDLPPTLQVPRSRRGPDRGMGQGVARLVAVPLDGRAGRTALVQARGRPLARRLPVPGKPPARHRIHDRRAGGLPPRPLRENPPPSCRRTQTGRIELLPLNRDYSPIIVTPHEAPPRSGDTPIRRSLGGFALPSTISSRYPIKNQQSEFINRQSNRVARGRWPCRETRQLLCRLALRTHHQAVRKIPCPVHDAFDTKGIAFHVKEQMAVERSFHLNAPHVSEFAAPSPGTRQCVGSFHARPTDSVRPRLPPFLDGP